MNRIGIVIGLAVGAVVGAGAGCKQSAAPKEARAELRQVTGNTFELLPREVELPTDKDGSHYCLVFTQSEKGVVRQLTMTHENKSLHCKPGEPIGAVRYRIPVEEGPVKVHVFISDQKLNAGSIAAQLYENSGNPSFHPMDLRLPGDVVVETLAFDPKQPTNAGSPMVGGVVGPSGEVRDGGSTRPASAQTDGGVTQL